MVSPRMKFPSFGRVCAASVALVAVLAGSGCASVEHGTDKTVSFVRGDLNTTVAGGYDAAVRATRAALAHLRFTLESELGDGVHTEFVARTALDKAVQVRVTRQTDAQSAVRIRVGAIGNEAIANSIISEIENRL